MRRRTKKICRYAEDKHMRTQAHHQISMRLLHRTQKDHSVVLLASSSDQSGRNSLILRVME